MAYGGDILGLRLFAGYGPGEEHKGKYASIIYQFCKQMIKDGRPVIWGDGTQSRDFVFIGDIVNTITENLDKTGIIDVGTGINTSFNEIIKIINQKLGKKIKPIYVKAPKNYTKETLCKNPIKTYLPVEFGIEVILRELT
jgi:ADP-L-glycero-D-manno-heptose 6-epimerase